MSHILSGISTPQFAEIKGFLSGYICTGAQGEGKPWIDSLMAILHSCDSGFPLKRHALIELYKELSHDIHQEELGLDVTLFAKEQSLIDRVYTLKNFCKGFVEGLSQGGFSFEKMKSMLPASATQELEIDHLDISDNDEKMFEEVTHHIEVSILTIYHAVHQGHSRH